MCLYAGAYEGGDELQVKVIRGPVRVSDLREWSETGNSVTVLPFHGPLLRSEYPAVAVVCPYRGRSTRLDLVKSCQELWMQDVVSVDHIPPRFSSRPT